MPPMTHKQCFTCQQVKQISMFASRGSKSCIPCNDSRVRRCRGCDQVKSFDVFITNGNGGLGFECRPCKRKRSNVEYAANKDERRKSERSRLSTLHGCAITILNNMKYPGRRDNRKVEFDTDTFTLPYVEAMLEARMHCPCCHEKFDYSVGHGRPNQKRPTADRIDPTKGYVRGNVDIICFRCNTMKNNLTITDMENVLKYTKDRLYRNEYAKQNFG